MGTKYAGPHVSIAGGVENAPLRARDIGAEAFGMFTKNQRRWSAPELSDASIAAFKANLKASGYTPDQVLPHDSYLINLGTPEPEARAKSLDAFLDEGRRCAALGLRFLNFHPGSHKNLISTEDSLILVAEALDRFHREVPEVMPVIETTAGQGTNLGSTFEEIRFLLDQLREPDQAGVCIDTCHIFAAGYSLTTDEDFQATFETFDRIIGFSFLKGMHLNDAKSTLGSRVDRHHSLGEGTLGWFPFEQIMKDSRFDAIPLILETIDPEKWPGEIEALYRWADKPNAGRRNHTAKEKK